MDISAWEESLESLAAASEATSAMDSKEVRGIREGLFHDDLEYLPKPPMELEVKRTSLLRSLPEQKASLNARLRQAVRERKQRVPEQYIVRFTEGSFPYAVILGFIGIPTAFGSNTKPPIRS